ncbi:ArnT family glycosyltransferase [Luteolibacter arcticus]|uniref:ArnT family glycosyltransferase n=1 Tax=Luteolibacter arcticus TaxID=1581411 RepID=UPI002223CC91|nr:glycosyltransferase family 39 protein [Luteolibacter arcticus]
MLCSTFVAFFLVQILTFDYGRDQGIYAVVARSIVDGGMPYRDAWDFKPPGIFVLYAIARVLFGANEWGIRLLECIFIAAMGICLVRWARAVFAPKLSGYFAIALAVLIHAQLDFWHTAQPESFGGALTIFGLCTAPLFPTADGRSPTRPLLRWFLAGVFFGMAGLLKPQLAFGGGLLVLLPCAARLLRNVPFLQAFAMPKDGPGEWRALFAACLGTVAPVALCVLWFAAKGALKDAYEVLFVFTPHYTKLSWEGQNPLVLAYHGVVDWFTGYSALVPLGVSLLLLFAHRLSSRERGAALAISLLISLHLAGVVAQAKFFSYHYGATWPLTGLLVGLGFALLWDQAVKASRLWIAAFVVGIPLICCARSAIRGVPLSFYQRTMFRTQALLSGGLPTEVRDVLATVDDVNASANRQVAQFLRDAGGTRPVFIWGFEPVIYEWANRPASTRYIYNVPQRAAWLQQTMRERLMADLTANPPEFIVIERRDALPSVTGNYVDSSGAIKDFPELRELIERRYKPAFSHEDFMVLKEVPAP